MSNRETLVAVQAPPDAVKGSSGEVEELRDYFRRRPLLILVAAILGALAFYVGMLFGASSDVPANTTVLGVQIGGMSRDEALAVLNTDVTPLANAPFQVAAFGTTSDVLPTDAGLSFDAQATVDAAVGKVLSPWAMVQRLFGPVAVDPVVNVNQGELQVRMEAFAAMVTSVPVEPELHYTGGQPELRPGQAGQAVDLPGAVNDVANGYLVADGPIELPEIVTSPTVSDQSAQATKDGVATIAVSAPIVIEVDSHSPSIDPQTIAAATRFVVEDGELKPAVDGAIVHQAISANISNLETPGSSATFEINDQGAPVVVPAKQGKGVSDDDLASAVESVLGQEGDARRTSVPVTTRDPAVTTEQAEQLGVVEQISTFTQEVSYSEYMAHNLALAAKYINGTLLLPGDIFSMNDKTENHDPVNGYMPGYVIGPGGVLHKELGGGISAATTATWSAAFYAGLEPIEVHAHSIYISRYVPGLEATVAWGGFDMQFRNNTPYGVFITASTTPTSMTVTMYGTKMYTDIKADVGERYWPQDYDTVYNQAKDCIEQAGGEGFTIDVKRLFYQGNDIVKRETFTTTYTPQPMVICGAPPKPQPEPSPSPSDSGSSDSGSSDSGSSDSGSSDSGSTDPGSGDSGGGNSSG